MSGTEIALTVIVGFLLALVAFVIYLWQKRVYAWLDDLYDRVAANNFEEYIFAKRIKFEIPLKPEITKSAKKINTEEEPMPPLFVQGANRRG